MRHAIRIAAIWLAVSIIVEILITILPIPSPTQSIEAKGEHQTLYMLFYLGAPIFVFVWVLFVYNLINFRYRPGEEEEPVATPDSTPILLLWAGISFVIVLFMAGWGTFTLHEITSQPSPPVASAQSVGHGKSYTAALATSSHPLVIQVIGQQWVWTFRYPSYGGMETRDLEVPVNTPILLHITSLDVVHSFWVYNYDIKEDAVPGVDNPAWFLPTKLGAFDPNGTNWVKCNELCGIWHGYMKTGLYVRTASRFVAWAKGQEAFEKQVGILKILPKYSLLYYPSSNANWPPAPQDQSP